jgi:hypothetical protein
MGLCEHHWLIICYELGHVQVYRQGRLGVESCSNPGDGDRVCLRDTGIFELPDLSVQEDYNEFDCCESFKIH